MNIPDKTKIQSIDLIIKDLNHSLKFYEELMGFRIIEKSSGIAFLSSNGKYPYLVKLEEDSKAKPQDKHSAGLYHTAFRFRDRISLGRTFSHLNNNQVKFHGFADHIVSEALYLVDPDGNGIELYVDKPRSKWEWKIGQIVMDTLPLDTSKITNEIGNKNNPYPGIDVRTEIGHIHLRVSALSKAEKFYSNFLGFNITNSFYNGALFMSAGGYHHHIGANIWSSMNGSKKDENTLGLKSFTINATDKKYLDYLKLKATKNNLDYTELPNSNGILLKDLDNINVMIVA